MCLGRACTVLGLLVAMGGTVLMCLMCLWLVCLWIATNAFNLLANKLDHLICLQTSWITHVAVGTGLSSLKISDWGPWGTFPSLVHRALLSTYVAGRSLM